MDLDRIADGYLYCALDLTDGAKRIPAATRAAARLKVQAFADRAGPWLVQALDAYGYAEGVAGHDLWLSASGSGVGFSDRHGFDVPPTAGTFSLTDRDGKPYSPEPGATLGECLDAAAYGTHTAIAPGAYCDAYASRGWLYLL